MLVGSYSDAPSGSSFMFSRIFSAFSWPASESWIWCAFSSTQKSPSGSGSFGFDSSFMRSRSGGTVLSWMYSSV